MRSASRDLPLRLDAETYRALEALGRAEDRDPLQQARWLIKQALASAKPAPSAPSGQELAG